MEPETEVVVFGILVTYFYIFPGNVEMLLAKGRVEVVIIQHHGWLYPAIKCDLVPVAMKEEPWTKPDFLNGCVVAFVYPARNDAPGAILPMFHRALRAIGELFGLVSDPGLLYLNEEADIGCEDLSHLSVAEHYVSSFLVGEKATLLAGTIDNADGGKELLAGHGKEVGEFCLGVHTVENLLDLLEILVGLGLMQGDGVLRLLALLLTYLLYVLTNLLPGRNFEEVTSLLVEFII